MNASEPTPSRDDLAAMYLDQLTYAPYPVQEEALLAWFTVEQGILVCAPTGTGKTLIAEAAMFEALKTRQVAYYTTPLIALTEQKFRELQEAAVRWGFSADDIGLVTGHRKVNPDAPVLVVVAEILLNRLLNPEGFDFSRVASVVMDEFHSFNDPERGVVWELSLALLPKTARLMLLSATVGNAVDFLLWMRKSHDRKVQLIQSQDRKVPLSFTWVGEQLLAEQIEEMCNGDENSRRTPALIFCFNRNECWEIAEQLKGKSLLADGQQKELSHQLDKWDWKTGSGPKLKSLLLRGVGVHHAGLLPKYRRRVEELFQKKLLSVCLCTETLAAGINLPARSVVMTTLMKGPPGKKSLVEASTAHQIFGRAGRPQFDTQGFVYALAHEDDVRIARWKKQYDQIPEDTKDPNLIRAKKSLKKKMPTRRSNEQYWNEDQFQKLIVAPPGHLASRGQLPWRLLAYLLQHSPDVNRLKAFVKKRLLDPKQLEKGEERLTQMLLTLYSAGFVELSPLPPETVTKINRDWEIPQDRSLAEVAREAALEDDFGAGLVDTPAAPPANEAVPDEEPEPAATTGTFGNLLSQALSINHPPSTINPPSPSVAPPSPLNLPPYAPTLATPTPELDDLLVFRTCHPLYATFLLDHLGIADFAEIVQALESVLEFPGSVIPLVRVPKPEELPPGPLASLRIDPELLSRGLITAQDLDPSSVEPELDAFGKPIRVFHVPLGDRLRRLFDAEYGFVGDLRTASVWVVGDLLHFGGDFQKYVTSRDLTKQEGLIFRHLLRMILLCQEFKQRTPKGMPAEEWQGYLDRIQTTLSESCHAVDPESTDKMLESMREDGLVEG